MSNDLIRSYEIHTKCLSCIHKKACPYAFSIKAENDPCGEGYSHTGIEQLVDHIDKMTSCFAIMADEKKRNGELRQADYYEGIFKDGKIEGNGVFRSKKNKFKYVGLFKNNKFHGNGKILFDDKSKYEGMFQEGITP